MTRITKKSSSHWKIWNSKFPLVFALTTHTLNFPREINAILWLIFPKKGLPGGSWLGLGKSSNQKGIILTMTGKGGIENDNKALWLSKLSLQLGWNTHSFPKTKVQNYVSPSTSSGKNNNKKKRAQFYRNKVWITTLALGISWWICYCFMSTWLLTFYGKCWILLWLRPRSSFSHSHPAELSRKKPPFPFASWLKFSSIWFYDSIKHISLNSESSL